MISKNMNLKMNKITMIKKKKLKVLNLIKKIMIINKIINKLATN